MEQSPMPLAPAASIPPTVEQVQFSGPAPPPLKLALCVNAGTTSIWWMSRVIIVVSLPCLSQSGQGLYAARRPGQFRHHRDGLVVPDPEVVFGDGPHDGLVEREGRLHGDR